MIYNSISVSNYESFQTPVMPCHRSTFLRPTLWTDCRSFQKWACIFTIFHAVVLLDSSISPFKLPRSGIPSVPIVFLEVTHIRSHRCWGVCSLIYRYTSMLYVITLHLNGARPSPVQPSQRAVPMPGYLCTKSAKWLSVQECRQVVIMEPVLPFEPQHSQLYKLTCAPANTLYTALSDQSSLTA